MKDYLCSKCSQPVDESELITVTNPDWVLKPTDDQCCPSCEGLCIEVSDE